MMPGSDYFDRRAARYLSESNRRPWRWVRSLEWRAIRGALDLSPGLSLLDAGCGAGYYSSLIRGVENVRIQGVDSSRPMIDAYRTQGFHGHLGSIESFPGGRRFDRILLAGVLEFVADVEPILERLSDLLSESGKIVCLTPKTGLRGFLYRVVHELQGCPVLIRSPGWYGRSARPHRLEMGRPECASPMSTLFVLRPSPRDPATTR